MEKRKVNVKAHKRNDPRIQREVDVTEYERNQKFTPYKKTTKAKGKPTSKKQIQTSLTLYLKKSSPAIKKIIEDISQTESYQKWLKLEEELDTLTKDAEKVKDLEKKKKINKEINKKRSEANQLYETFRFIIGEDIIKEDKEWVDEFISGLRESHRYKYRRVEDLENRKLEKIPNPFFDTIFKYSAGKYSSPIMVELSKNGETALLKFNNMRPDGSGFKAPEYTYNTFSRVLRYDYNAKWDAKNECYVIPINELDDALKKLKDSNVYLQYHVKDLKFNDKASWLKRANVPKTIIEKTDNLILEVEGSKVKIKGANSSIEMMARMDINQEFSRERTKDGKKKRYDAVEYTDDGRTFFNVGLLDECYWYLEGLGYHPAIADDRPKKIISSPTIKGIDLYDFQKKAIVEALIEGNGLIVSPTGSGKTEIASGIAGGYIDASQKLEEKTGKQEESDILFLVHRGTLAEQAEKRFEKRLGVNVGRLSSDEWDPLNTKESDINISTLQGLHKALENKEKKKPLSDRQKKMLEILDEAEVIMMDEAHHVLAKTFGKVFEANPTQHKYGFTATPDRYDQQAILEVMRIGSKRQATTLPDLQKRGILMKPKVILYDIPKNRESLDRGAPIVSHGESGSYRELRGMHKFIDEYQYQIHHNEWRNDFIIDLVKKEDKENRTTIVFTYLKDHAKKLKKQYEEDTGKIAPLLTGDVKSSDIKQRIKRLEDGTSKVAFATSSLLGEGFDLPNLDSLFICDGHGSSQIQTMQRAGRTMRKFKGKKQPKIFEFNDKTKYLEKHTQERLKQYKDAKAFDIVEKGVPEVLKKHIDNTPDYY